MIEQVIGNAKLYTGDCIETLRTMPDCSVDSIVTDPPYEMGFMGKGWDKTGIANSVELWTECLRVLKPGGHLLAFSGSRTYHRMTCAIEDAGFEVRDQIMWVYGSGFPKSMDVAKAIAKVPVEDLPETVECHDDRDALLDQWEGWGTALKPAHEPICVARKPLAVKTVARNVLEHGTGALNIDGCRVHGEDAQARSYTVKRFAPGASVNKDGNWKQDVSFSGETKPGRWPANLIHDGSEEVTAMFPAQAGAAAPVHTRNADKFRNSYGQFKGNVDEAGSTFYGDAGSAARFFYCAKASREDRNEGLQSSSTPLVARDATMRHCETVDWSARNGNHHPTVKPTDLMRYLCRLVTPPGGVVLDCFMGSGSTGKAATLEGFAFIGIDITPEYVEISAARILHAQATPVQLELVA